jgi:hypothetical protein
MGRDDVTGTVASDLPRDIGAGGLVARSATGGPGDVAPQDDTVIGIRVSHGSIEEADYAVMVGSYEDEALGGAERFLDRQLGGVLAATYEAGSYPGPFDGNALFIRPHPDVERRTSPPGAYIVGLGRGIDVTRSRVRRAVGQALIDRCLQLENWPADEATEGVREVGVSSSLLGVRDGDGVSVSEAIAGIVEGVIDANRALMRYETARRQAGTRIDRAVRITDLELIERFGDRADLAAMAVRRLPNTVQLGIEYVTALADVVVRRKRGGLPAGAALADSPREWRRFSITSLAEVDAAGDDDAATLTFDVSFLGGEARADRMVHRLDRVVVEALAARLSTHSADDTSAATLYDLLVPEQMRHRFQSAPSVQLVVDQTSANYPWELLSAPTLAGRADLATQGSVIRQFSETASRRIVVERATRDTALVIGAGNVPGMTPLPGAIAEARKVRDMLTRFAPCDRLHHLDDVDGELSTVDVVNVLDGDHQIIHIASHGEYVDDDPAATGAVLNRDFRLRVETVRQLHRVPDLVFLNCCMLGRVGTARLAAGLAREFMAIGTRAVIAAGWPVGDAAAAAFATTFYQHLLDGVSFAGSVAAARNATLAMGGRETWAAYQCYGDPELVLDGASGRSTVDEGDPVSVDDLLRRLKSVEVRASDLGRPGAGRLDRRHELLVKSFEGYATWAESHGVLAPRSTSSEEHRAASAVQRQLARVAAELGQFRAAATRYLSLVGPAAGGGLPRRCALGRWTNVEDLQQASNCLSRAAQQDARADTSKSSHPAAVADLQRAVELARDAVDITGEDESYGILGGALKRLATIVPEDRDELVRQAADAYERRPIAAGDDTTPEAVDNGPYTRLTAAQLALLLDPRQPEPPEPPARPAALAIAVRIDSRAVAHADYWDVAAAGDRLLTRLLARRPGDDAATVAADMVSAYERAFGCRSTWRERASSIDHLCDLRDLLGEDDERRARLVGAITSLKRWERDNVAAEAVGR